MTALKPHVHPGLSRQKGEQGYTLIELLVALALIGLLLTMTLSVLLRTNDSSTTLQARVDLTSEAQMAQNYMVSKLREAAYVFLPSGSTASPATLTINNSGYSTYNGLYNSYVWRLGIDPIVAFILPPKNVTTGGCAAATSAATATVDNRSLYCYAFYAFYAVPRSQLSTGVSGKFGPATGTNFPGVNPQNDGTTWMLMEYRGYYTDTGFSTSKGDIPTTGNATSLLDFVRPAATGETLFSQAGTMTANSVTVNIASQQQIKSQLVRVPGTGRYSIRVYPRNLDQATTPLDN